MVIMASQRLRRTLHVPPVGANRSTPAGPVRPGQGQPRQSGPAPAGCAQGVAWSGVGFGSVDGRLVVWQSIAECSSGGDAQLGKIWSGGCRLCRRRGTACHRSPCWLDLLRRVRRSPVAGAVSSSGCAAGDDPGGCRWRAVRSGFSRSRVWRGAFRRPPVQRRGVRARRRAIGPGAGAHRRRADTADVGGPSLARALSKRIRNWCSGAAITMAFATVMARRGATARGVQRRTRPSAVRRGPR